MPMKAVVGQPKAKQPVAHENPFIDRLKITYNQLLPNLPNVQNQFQPVENINRSLF